MSRICFLRGLQAPKSAKNSPKKGVEKGAETYKIDNSDPNSVIEYI